MLQLDLFEGAILNAKQQTQLETFIDNQVVRSQNAKIKNEETEIALIDAGFVKGVDFNNLESIQMNNRCGYPRICSYIYRVNKDKL